MHRRTHTLTKSRPVSQCASRGLHCTRIARRGFSAPLNDTKMSDNRRRTYCCVYGCLNNSSIPELSLFRLPSDQERRLQWLRLIDREDLINISQPKHVVCETHFHPEDIMKNSVRKLLKKNCLPGLNLPNLKKNDKPTQVEKKPSYNIFCQTETTSASGSNEIDLTTATSSCQTDIKRSPDSRAQTTPPPAAPSAQVPSPRTPDDSSQASSQDPLVKLITFETKIEQTLDPLQDSHTTEATLADSQTGTVTVTTSSEPQHTNKIKAIKRKVFRRTRPYVDNTLMNALHRLESTVSELVTAGQSQEQPTGAQPEDEFHMFALSVAAQLRQLPLHVAITTQSKIQSTLTEARLTSLFPTMLSPPAVCTVKTEDITIE